MNSIETKQFYGKSSDAYKLIIDQKLEKSLKCKSDLKKNVVPMPDRLLGPTQFWEEFAKQADALKVLNERSRENEPLSLFVYQDSKGFRHFVVAHPEVYWWYYKQRSPETRCSYEVIQENEPCLLYFDLEFNKEKNPESEGPAMTKTLIEVTCMYILKTWGYLCKEKNVVNLDSTTDTKFSRHLIFRTKDIAFADNFHMGIFVKRICWDLIKFLFDKVPNDVLKLFKKKDLERLFVETDKGKRVFIDTAVYTRNRHFRVFKSTKWGKESYLTLAPESQYAPTREQKDQELRIFLDSLISFFPSKRDLLLLEFDDQSKPDKKCYNPELTSTRNCRMKDFVASPQSQYPELDKFVNEMLKPGKIRLCKYHEGLKMVTYEVYGNRYCRNIGRSHKSNNIYWVVDLRKKAMFQKCYDEDCSGFASEPVELPDVVKFTIDEEIDRVFAFLPDELFSHDSKNEASERKTVETK